MEILSLASYVFLYIILKLLYENFDMCKHLAEGSNVWYIIPISLATTILLSNKRSNNLLTKILSTPEKSLYIAVERYEPKI